MTGSGGMGSMPSSRLARILQEKAESLKKRRLDAEAAADKVEERVRQLEELGVTLPETAERRERLAEVQRRSDWEAVENRAREFLQYVDRAAGPELEKRRTAILANYDALQAARGPMSADAATIAEELRATSVAADFSVASTRVVALVRVVKAGEAALAAELKSKSLALAKWADVPADRTRELEARVSASIAPISDGGIADALERVRKDLQECVPEAAERRERIRTVASGVVALARELGASSAVLDAALAVDADAFPTRWLETVKAVDGASTSTAEELRGRVRQSVEGLRNTVSALSEQGAEPAESVAEIDELLARITASSAAELPGLLQGARAAAEGPVVGVVVSLLDEVRPRLVQARQLGRDPSEVFASMNRAREALRLKIYGEALAASRDALDRVSHLTADLDEAREEVDSLRMLIDRLRELGVPVTTFQQALARADQELSRIEVEKARTIARETIRGLGLEAARFFTARLQQLQSIADIAKERGFLPEDVPSRLTEVRRKVEQAALADAGELLARVDVELRTAAGPYVARRVEELEKGFQEVVDPQLTATTRRYLADTDVSLRVKEDLAQSLESLRRAEHESTLVFAAHAANLVERLEVQHRTLEEMGGASADLQREIDEVQQIFNMGEFLKASHATQELLARVRDQQTAQSEEAISHAKLALVELSKMGVDTAEMRRRFDQAQEASHQGQLVEAYRGAAAVEKEAGQLRASAQGVADRIGAVTTRAENLRELGVTVDPYLQRLEEARESYAAHRFEAAMAQIEGIALVLEGAADESVARRLLDEASAMTEDARKLAVPAEEIEADIARARTALEAGQPHEAVALAQQAHARVIGLLKPVAAENMKALEQDVEIAREAGLDLQGVSESLAEARRRLIAAVPTGVAERIETTRSQLMETRGFLEHAELAARRVREAYAQAEILHLSTTSVRERVDGLDRSLSERQYARVIEAAGPLERELIQSTNQHVARIVAGLQGTLVHARQEGSPTTVAENLLGLARQALQQGKPIDALQLAGKSEAEVERFGLQTRLARGAVEILEAKITRLESEGIRVPSVTELAVAAREALEQHELTKALETAINAHDALAEAGENYRHARDALDAADRQIKEAMEFGADVAEVVALLEEARRRAQGGDYSEASARAREAADLSRWAIERLYAGSLAQVRDLAEMMRTLGIEASGPVSASLEEAEVALQGKEWKRAGDLLDRARSFAVATLDRLVDRRAVELEERLGEPSAISPEAAQERRAWKARLGDARDRRDYGRALELIKEEEERAVGSSRAALEHRLETLKECLWVGEKLGLDTTPAMERFSEAKLALGQGNLMGVASLVDAGTLHLEGQIEQRIPARAKELETELVFARDGLHVAIGNLEERLGAARRQAEQHQPIDSARTLLAVDEELTHRKVRHRELANLHYLIGAALQRAADKQIDAGEARRLLEESILTQETDYDRAVEQASAALKILEGLIQAIEPPAGTWPFRRLPPS